MNRALVGVEIVEENGQTLAGPRLLRPRQVAFKFRREMRVGIGDHAQEIRRSDNNGCSRTSLPHFWASSFFGRCPFLLSTTPPIPGEPVASLQPVPAGGTFTCATYTFSNFSSNILNGGLIGASAIYVPYVGAPTDFTMCCGASGAIYLLFEVQPVLPELGWSYSVSAAGAPIAFAKLPPLNHVTSGSPAVTEHFTNAGGSLALSPGSGYVRLPAALPGSPYLFK